MSFAKESDIMLLMIDRNKYLQRIGLENETIGVNADGLRRLQRSHLLQVPFENLDIHWKRPIFLDTGRFYEKVVNEKRGGYCYELNGLFNELLRSIGFQTRIVSARVFNGSSHGPEFDHAAIIVTISGDEYLADVGFGDFAAEPLRFVLDEKQTDSTGAYLIRRFDDDYLEAAKLDDSGWKSAYIFKDVARNLSEFEEMNEFQQHSPASHFIKGKLCSIMTEKGRKTLTEKAFIVTMNGDKTERAIDSDEIFSKTLGQEFRIEPNFLVERN